MSTLAMWLDRLETLHPSAIDLGLDRVQAVAQRLDLVQDPPRTITVAGTNGKGSCVATLSALLIAEGYRVGCYTSPHLVHFTERIQIDAQSVEDEAVVAAFDAIEIARGDITLTYFEYTTLAALWLFRESSVDWQILEVGLGGRLDAVNIIDADACVITSIGLDHTDWLGDTLDLIAIEKAGVARAQKPAVVAQTDAPEALYRALSQHEAVVLANGRDWRLEGRQLCWQDHVNMEIPEVTGLLESNVAAAILVLSSLGVTLTQNGVSKTLASLSLSGRQQRLQWCGREVWLDVAHNAESAALLAKTLRQNPTNGRRLGLFAAMADKPLRAMLAGLESEIDAWYLPAVADLSRAAAPEAVAAEISNPAVTRYTSVAAAWEAVLEAASAGDRIVVFGSFVTVGAVMPLMQREEN